MLNLAVDSPDNKVIDPMKPQIRHLDMKTAYQSHLRAIFFIT